jgi:hypothetical protein
MKRDKERKAELKRKLKKDDKIKIDELLTTKNKQIGYTTDDIFKYVSK